MKYQWNLSVWSLKELRLQQEICKSRIIFHNYQYYQLKKNIDRNEKKPTFHDDIENFLTKNKKIDLIYKLKSNVKYTRYLLLLDR